MRLFQKQTGILFGWLFLFMFFTQLSGQQTKPLGSVNYFRIKKLQPFMNKVCTVFTNDNQIHLGRLDKIDFKQITIVNDSSPFHKGIFLVPLYDIQKITSGYEVQVFLNQTYKKESLPIVQLEMAPKDSTAIVAELLAILEEAAPAASEFADSEDDLELLLKDVKAAMDENE